ncbi:MAG: hypothetical protein WD845_03935 [Pirellulales bacterium]
MGERNSVHAFKGPTAEQICAGIEDAVAELGGQVHWDQRPDSDQCSLWVSHNNVVHSAVFGQRDYEIASFVAVRFNCPYLNVRIQEGSLWEYSLFLGATHLDNFSTLPEYWVDLEFPAEGELEWLETRRGQPQVLAQTWGIDQKRIERYLRPWGWNLGEDCFTTTLRGKAYESDHHEAGDIWQMTDFLEALGACAFASDEMLTNPHRLDVPERPSGRSTR